MKSKKIASLILAAVLVLSLSVPAFAATTQTGATANGLDEANEGANFEFEASANGATIKLTIPAAADFGFVLNPYRLDVSAGNNKTAGWYEATATDDDQVISPALYIANYSNVPIGVTYVAKATPGTGVQVSTGTINATETAKKILLYIETQTASGTTDPGDWAEAFDSKNTAIVAFTTGGAKNKDTLTLAAGNGTTGLSSSEDGVLWYKLGGEMTTQPTTDWTSDDTITASLVFTFRPAANAAD